MKLISNLAHIDKQAIEELGIPGLLLMEEAGRQVAEAVMSVLDIDKNNKNDKGASIVIFCGPGNNGGDGFVCARKLVLLDKNSRITVIHATSAKAYHGDAKTNFDLLKHYPINIVHAEDTITDEIEALILNADVLVDALFGSGLDRPIDSKSMAGQIIETVNNQSLETQSTASIVAIDIPSGISGETGQVLGSPIKADLTISFATGKPGLYLPPGKHYSGLVEVVDIGIPQHLIDKDPSFFRLTTQESVISSLPQRKPDSHKYSTGCLMIIAGSKTMPGAAQLSAEAALSSGAGLVILASPDSVFDQLQLMPEIVHLPLPESKDGVLTPSAIPVILKNIQEKKCRAIALGPGLGQSSETHDFIHQLLPEIKKLKLPIVIDADGLNALAHKGLKEELDEKFTILTPHVGECARLLKRPASDIENDLLRAANDTQEVWACHVVLKSSTVVTAQRKGNIWLNPTGNAGMATAGTGDVLTGIIASLAAQGISPEQAATCGAYLHGLAGDLAAEELSPQAMKASDITRYLPQAFQHRI